MSIDYETWVEEQIERKQNERELREVEDDIEEEVEKENK